MAINPEALPENQNRITPSSSAYPYGSAKDDSTGTAGDGTPIKQAYMNDIYGFQQWLLSQAEIVPSGTADNALTSQYGEALKAIFATRAAPITRTFTTSGTYTPTSGCSRFSVLVIGGGGGSGAIADGGSGQAGAGAGSGAGWSIKEVGDVGASYAVTVGGPGAAGTAGGDGATGATRPSPATA